MENILFRALLAVVGLIRWLSQVAEDRKNKEAARRQQEQNPAPNQPIPRAAVDSEEERIRKFMEALGVPTTTARPEPPPREAAPPPPPQRKPPLMPVDPFPRPWPTVTRTPPPVAAPAPAAPPPLMPPAPTAVPTTTSVQPPPLPTRPEPLARRRAAEVDPYDVDRQLGDEDETIADAGELAKNRTAAAKSLAARLSTSQGLRDAIVLREIFGPPRSMQPLDLTRPS